MPVRAVVQSCCFPLDKNTFTFKLRSLFRSQLHVGVDRLYVWLDWLTRVKRAPLEFVHGFYIRSPLSTSLITDCFKSPVTSFAPFITSVQSAPLAIELFSHSTFAAFASSITLVRHYFSSFATLDPAHLKTFSGMKMHKWAGLAIRATHLIHLFRFFRYPR